MKPVLSSLALALARDAESMREDCLTGVARADSAPGSGASLPYIAYSLLADETLVERLRGGDADALTILFERHAPRLLSFARRILRNDAEAEDAVQQSFLDAYRAIDRYDGEKGNFRNWLLVLTYHRTLNHRRRLAAQGPLVEFAEESLPLQNGDQQHRHAYPAVETGILLRQLLETLKPAQRRAIELIHYQGLTAEEAALRTGASVRSVRHNLYRGLEKLRKLLFTAARTTTSPRKDGKR